MKLFKDKFSENLPSLDNSYEFTVTSSHGGRLHSSRINSDLISRVQRKFSKKVLSNPKIYPFQIFVDDQIVTITRAEPQGVPFLAPKGRFSILREQGGKVRVFAIPSAFGQYILKPVHNWIFDGLRVLESDFTHDQNEFRRNYFSGVNNWINSPSQSYDLKSATDTFPVRVQEIMLNALLNSSFGTE